MSDRRTTPGTRIHWATLGEWVEGWATIQSRRHSRTRHAAEDHHVGSFPRDWIAKAGRAELEGALAILEGEDTRAQRGIRAPHPSTLPIPEVRAELERRAAAVRVSLVDRRSSGRGFYAQYVDPKTGRRIQRRLGTEDPEEARKRAQNRADALEGAVRMTKTDGTSTPMRDALFAWHHSTRSIHSVRTRRSNRVRVERLAELLGDVELGELAPSDAERYAGDALERFAPETVAVDLQVLGRVCSVAVRDRVLERHPLPELGTLIGTVRRRRAASTSRSEAWTGAELETLLRAVDAERPLRVFLPLLLLTGARRGEALALAWEDVDLEAAQVHWVATVTPDGKLAPPKWGRTRIQPIPRRLVELLAEEKRRRDGLRSSRLRPEVRWVCESPRGRLWNEANASRAFADWRRTAWPRGVEKLSLHCARHTYITLGLTAGVATATIAAQVGASTKTIETTYAHVIPNASGSFFDRVAGGEVSS